MYERNAIIIERYFNNMFGYNIQNNIKTNYENYCRLVEAAEIYKNCTEEEEEVIIEYDIIANKIRDAQKKQEELNKQNLELQDERNNFFQNIDEDANLIQKNLDIVNNNIKKIDEEIQENATNFINIVAEFNEKSIVRNKCGKKRRSVEIDYNKKLNDTLDNYKNIDINLEKRAKNFNELDTTEIQNELKNEIQKNGKNEKIPFQKEVIEQAIILSIDNQKKETEILSNIYEKTNKLFSEIRNNNLKIEKHRKIILESNSKLEFISALKEYVIQFLDNERLAAVNGEHEYNKLMKDACKNLENDLVQINKLYILLLKEISRKATKKSYTDLYNIEYLNNLENKAEEFENEVKKLKLPVAVINPNYWRIEGMRRIYDVFNKCVTENYDRDLKEFISFEDDSDEDDSDVDEKESVIIKNSEENLQKSSSDKQKDNLKNLDTDSVSLDDNKSNNIDVQNDDKLKSEIDKKIDIILGLQDFEKNKDKKVEKSKDSETEEDWEEDDIENEEVDIEEDLKDDDDIDEDWEEADIEDDEDWEEDETGEDWEETDIEDEEDWKEDDIVDHIFDDKDTEDGNEDEIEEDNEEDIEEEWEEDTKDYESIDFDDEADYDIWGNNINKKNKTIKSNTEELKEKKENEWENEFINIDKKDKKKKKGFFNKFK